MTELKTLQSEMVLDKYWDFVQEYWSTIHRAYGDFADTRPVILVAIDEARVYAYPREEFKKELSAKSQAMLDEQYAEADAEGEIVVFVRDDTRRKLVSYSCPWEPSTERPNNQGTALDRGQRAIRKNRQRRVSGRGK